MKNGSLPSACIYAHPQPSVLPDEVPPSMQDRGNFPHLAPAGAGRMRAHTQGAHHWRRRPARYLDALPRARPAPEALAGIPLNLCAHEARNKHVASAARSTPQKGEHSCPAVWRACQSGGPTETQGGPQSGEHATLRHRQVRRTRRCSRRIGASAPRTQEQSGRRRS